MCITMKKLLLGQIFQTTSRRRKTQKLVDVYEYVNYFPFIVKCIKDNENMLELINTDMLKIMKNLKYKMKEEGI